MKKSSSRLFAFVLCAAMIFSCSITASADETAGSGSSTGTVNASGDSSNFAVNDPLIKLDVNGTGGGTIVSREEDLNKVDAAPILAGAEMPETTEAAAAAPAIVKNYKDVLVTDWFAPAVEYVTDAGVMVGTAEDAFSPGAKATRAMIITMLARLNGTDIADATPWYAKAVDWAVAGGISDGTDPNGNVTREQIACMLYRLVGSPEVKDVDLTAFNDADKISDWAVDALKWANQQGIINGKGNGVLDPQGSATRAEIAQMFMCFMKGLDDGSIVMAKTAEAAPAVTEETAPAATEETTPAVTEEAAPAATEETEAVDPAK